MQKINLNSKRSDKNTVGKSSARSGEKKINKNRTNLPKHTAFGNFLLVALTRIWRLFLHGKSFKTEAYKKERKNGAALILSNHLCAFDFVFFTAAAGGKLNFVVAENMMYSKPIFARLIKYYHAIIKKQNFADFQCVKNIKRCLDAGISVVLCPEGKVSSDGKTGVIAPAAARLIKWLGYPVMTVVSKGAGLMRPKWAYKNRKVKVITTCDVLFTAENVKSMSQQTIHDMMIGALNHNEHLYQQETGLEVRSRVLAEGLERQLYYCPKCGAEFCMKSKNDLLFCTACGNTVRYTSRGELKPIDADSVSLRRIDLWTDKQRELILNEIKEDEFKLSNHVFLLVENEKEHIYRYAAEGIITLTKELLTFEALSDRRSIGVKPLYGVNSMDLQGKDAENTEPVEDEFKKLTFKVKLFSTIANMPGDTLDLYDDKHIYRILFADVRASTKYTLAVEAMNA